MDPFHGRFRAAISGAVLCALFPLGPAITLAAPNDNAPTRGATPSNVFEPGGTPLPPRPVPDGDWIGLSIGSDPTRRLQPAYALDPGRHRIVLFGGANGPYLDDCAVIALDAAPIGAALATEGARPSPRRLARAVFDPLRDRLIVFGGYDGSYYNDLWQLSFATSPPTWSALVAAGPAPVPRAGHAMVYDANGDRVIVFGGHDGVTPGTLRRNDVWELSLSGAPAWSPIVPQGVAPAARSSHSAVYDGANDRMIVFGGTSGSEVQSYLNDTWQLDLDGTPSWSEIAQSRRPPRREEQVLDFDAARERLVMHGGYDAFQYLSDTWVLDLAGVSRWDPVRTLSDAAPSARWGHVGVHDPVHDRLVVFGGYGAGYLGDTWAFEWSSSMDPLALAPAPEEPLAATSVVRTIAVRALASGRVRCALASAAPATLELLDVSGRRLAVRELPGAGEHDVDFAGTGLAAGVYFARLTQDGAVAATRVAVTR